MVNEIMIEKNDGAADRERAINEPDDAVDDDDDEKKKKDCDMLGRYRLQKGEGE